MYFLVWFLNAVNFWGYEDISNTSIVPLSTVPCLFSYDEICVVLFFFLNSLTAEKKLRKSFFTLLLIPMFREFPCFLAYGWITGISPYWYGLRENSVWLEHRVAHLNAICCAIIWLTRLSIAGTLPLSQSWSTNSIRWWALVTFSSHKTDFKHHIFLYFSSLCPIFPVLRLTGSFQILKRKKQYFE